jgi:hypothetical protein
LPFLHIFPIFSLFDLLFFYIIHLLSLLDLPFFLIFQAFHYSTYLSSIFSISYHY